MDAIHFWPRIISVASKESLEAADDARSSVDCFVNCSVLSALLAAILFVAGCSVIDAGTPAATLIRWPLETGAAALSAFLFYEGSVRKVGAWGAQVRSIFDLHRGDLLKKLGYQQTPSNRVDERALWGALSKELVYGDPPKGSLLPYLAEKPRTRVTCDPADMELEFTAGVTEHLFGQRQYLYRITNVDVKGREAKDVTLVESLPQGLTYVWNSAKKNNERAVLTGSNPYQVRLGLLHAQESVEFSYRAMKDI